MEDIFLFNCKDANLEEIAFILNRVIVHFLIGSEHLWAALWCSYPFWIMTVWSYRFHGLNLSKQCKAEWCFDSTTLGIINPLSPAFSWLGPPCFPVFPGFFLVERVLQASVAHIVNLRMCESSCSPWGGQGAILGANLMFPLIFNKHLGLPHSWDVSKGPPHATREPKEALKLEACFWLFKLVIRLLLLNLLMFVK